MSERRKPPTASPAADVSQLLIAWGQGDHAALGRLMPLVYRELSALARRHMRRERHGHSWQTSDLVGEAYLRLVQQRDAQWRHRGQFFAVAASIMRRLLVDRARRHRYQKRGGGAVRVALEDIALVSSARADEVVALDEALHKLEAYDRRKLQVVELRYFGGMTVDEIARFLDVSPITVKRDWALAKAWLYRELKASPPAR